ncbi:type VII secretion target [Mycobacterium sp. E740]|uniref:type VII secretion target n=1 Tax=Mycobacterium sp. E740 TaxID=1834149 RepID=UPI0007FC83F0|nr:type VII secretion target [Mycobacterium sp. E740]OBI78764.1 hypothetical protein A5663_01905 [Mycobacterium sp. E740]
MGAREASRVDAAALLSIAGQYELVAGLIDGAVRTHLGELTFDGAGAGRSYVAHGDAVRSAVEDVVSGLRQWSRASAEIAAVLRVSADRYVEADVYAARRLV